jgi:hypothetical protein
VEAKQQTETTGNCLIKSGMTRGGQSLGYLSAAIVIEPRGIYYYLVAYIKYDYFSRKYFKISPDYKETLIMAAAVNPSEHDIKQLFEILNVERPVNVM